MFYVVLYQRGPYIVMNIATGPPRFSGGRKSETIAIPILKPGLAKSPAKSLQTIKDAIF